MSGNPNYKPSEGKREEFRKYLEKTGVMEALTKVLVSLYEEPDKPENAVEYICNKLATQVCGETLDSIRASLEDAQTTITDLKAELEKLSPQEGGDEGEEEQLDQAGGEAPGEPAPAE